MAKADGMATTLPAQDVADYNSAGYVRSISPPIDPAAANLIVSLLRAASLSSGAAKPDEKPAPHWAFTRPRRAGSALFLSHHQKTLADDRAAGSTELRQHPQAGNGAEEFPQHPSDGALETMDYHPALKALDSRETRGPQQLTNRTARESLLVGKVTVEDAAEERRLRVDRVDDPSTTGFQRARHLHGKFQQFAFAQMFDEVK